ncbi:hypothetical protein [Methylosinus sp. sav-2]|uniref:hypothetical protein n=1 Tax=Methylosinus sp. sav-2 TaxID=2485168 RepID=UPI0012F67929|nr:hypothetical protein [Methylosinus sp. sav-2]
MQLQFEMAQEFRIRQRTQRVFDAINVGAFDIGREQHHQAAVAAFDDRILEP